MESKEKRVDQIRKNLKDLEIQRRNAQTFLGEKLFSHYDLSPLGQEKLLQGIKRLSREIEGINDTIKEIGEVQENIKILTERKKETVNEIELISKESHQLYENIGKQFFLAYKNGEIDQKSFNDIFSPALVKEERIIQVREDLHELEKTAKEKNFLKMVVDSGKKTVLLGNLSLHQKSLSKEFEKAGERICQEGLLENQKNSGLAAAVEPFLRNKQLINDLTAQKQALEGEVNSFSYRLSELADGKKASAKITELEEKKHRSRNELEEQFHDAAGHYINNPELISAPLVSEEMEKLSALKDSTDQQKKEYEQLTASLEIERLDKKMEDINLRIRTLEDNIKRQQEEIKRHKREITKAQKDKELLEPVAYPKNIEN